MMKLNSETLRHFYLKDLELPDTFHGRTTPKGKYPELWKKVETKLKNGTAIDITDRNVWVWSDQHLGHNNAIELCGRPFTTTDEMTSALIANAQRVVGPDDVLIFVGDIGFKSRGVINSMLDSIPCYKIHIVGNHDMERDGKVIDYNVDERYLCYVHDAGDIQLWFTHYPMDNVPSNCVNVHGHIHQNLANPWNINVSVEHIDYTPINLTDVLERARNYVNSK